MSKSGKQIVAEAAKRAKQGAENAFSDERACGAIYNEFAPVAELIDAIREQQEAMREYYNDSSVTSLRRSRASDRLGAALAEVEKLGGE